MGLGAATAPSRSDKHLSSALEAKNPACKGRVFVTVWYRASGMASPCRISGKQAYFAE
jgi:hypothetical protein